MPIQTKLSTTHEVVVLVPLVDLAQMLLKEKFNIEAKTQFNLSPTHLHLVQFDRKEREEAEPPSAVDPDV